MAIVEAKEKAFADMSSIPFLQELEKLLLDSKVQKGVISKDTKSLVKVALTHMQRGLEYYYMGQYRAALREYKVVLSIIPNSSVAQTRLGSIYYQLGDTEKAVSTWKKALKLNPEDASLKIYLKNLVEQEEGESEEPVESPGFQVSEQKESIEVKTSQESQREDSQNVDVPAVIESVPVIQAEAAVESAVQEGVLPVSDTLKQTTNDLIKTTLENSIEPSVKESLETSIPTPVQTPTQTPIQTQEILDEVQELIE